MDAEKILTGARSLLKRMIESNRPKPASVALKEGLIPKSEVEEAKQGLAAVVLIPSHAVEAKKLLDQIKQEETAGKNAMQAAAAKALADDSTDRKSYAKTLEEEFLGKGFDVTVAAGGPKATTLTMRFVLFNRPMVYQLTNDGTGHETNLVSTWRQLGFKRAVFSDGYDKSWTLTLGSH